MHMHKVLADWLKVFCLCQHVPTRHIKGISMSIRRTQGFDIHMLMLVPWLSLLAHKLFLCLSLHRLGRLCLNSQSWILKQGVGMLHHLSFHLLF